MTQFWNGHVNQHISTARMLFPDEHSQPSEDSGKSSHHFRLLITREVGGLGGEERMHEGNLTKPHQPVQRREGGEAEERGGRRGGRRGAHQAHQPTGTPATM